MLQAILFDIDDTLCATTAFAKRARTAAVRAMIDAGLDLAEEVVLRELDEVLLEFGSNYDHHYDKLLHRLRPKDLAVNPALVVAAGVAAYHDTKFHELKPFDDVIPLFEDLVRANIRIGIITHGWTVKQAEKLIRLKLVPYIQPNLIFISDQIGIAKPNPKLYRSALAELQLEPKQVMYVGDNVLHDVAPPKNIGMVSVWASRAAKRGLQGTGIEPDHVIVSFDDLREILREKHGIDIPQRQERAG